VDLKTEGPSASSNGLSGVERFFDDDEIIVSKTDLTGKIIYANDVFCRISGYAEAELIGRPHSILRHPKMPRVVFKVLWDRIQADQEIFAFVLNRSRSGDEYWVYAHVTPTFHQDKKVGYHSNRRTVNRSALPEVRQIYARLLAEEQRHPQKGDAVAASARVLDQMLDEARMSYDELVWSLESRVVAVAS
jgi:PAS domain S-box-containing protein